MKNNKLFNAMGNIDEELINEAVNAPKKRRLPVMKFTAAAAVLAVVALSTAVIVNISKKSDIIAEPDGSDIQVSGNKETDTTETKGQQDEGSDIVFAGHYSVPSDNSEGNKPSQSSTAEPVESTPASQTSESSEPVSSTSETPSVQQGNDEESDMLGFIIKDGNTYMQVFGSTEYTLDEDIGRAGDFRGYYSDLDDNSRVYTVKEDERILVVKFESGGSVTLMLWDESAQDSMGYYNYNGLRVDRSVMAALSSNDGKTYSVYVTRPDSEDMYDYVYNGKTLRQIKEELDESWKTEHGKYNPLDEEFQAACHAFLKEKIKAAYDILTAQGIKAELINEVRCEAEMTKEQFEALAASYTLPDEYAFGLASGGYLTDDEA